MNIDITFPNAPCPILSLDIVDVTGVHVVNIEGRLHKNVLDPSGKKMFTIDATKAHDLGQDIIYASTVEGLKNEEGC